MQAPKQPVGHWLMRGALVATVCAFSVATWAQGGKPVAPPPADLEPGVNTSATQPSSSDAPPPAAPTSVPAPTAKKPAPTPVRPTAVKADAAAAPAPGSAPAGSAPVSGTPAAATTSTIAGTSPAPKTGAPAGKAHDKIELDTTQITGNRELPKVLYIVPWKRSDLGDLVGKPVNSLLDEVLTPVDRDVFKRQNRYYDALKPDDAKDAAGAAAGATEKH